MKKICHLVEIRNTLRHMNVQLCINIHIFYSEIIQCKSDATWFVYRVEQICHYLDHACIYAQISLQ